MTSVKKENDKHELLLSFLIKQPHLNQALK